MDSKYYMPFVRSVITCFESNMHIKPDLKRATEASAIIEKNDICALLVISGEIDGVAGIALSEDVANKAVGNFLGNRISTIHSNIYDAVGEIIQIIGDSAKAEYEECKLELSLPSVMHGEEFLSSLPKDGPLTNLGFDLPDIGKMNMVISISSSS